MKEALNKINTKIGTLTKTEASTWSKIVESVELRAQQLVFRFDMAIGSVTFAAMVDGG